MTVELIQGTDDWRLARCGMVTASSVYKVVAKTKNGWGAERKNYRADLVLERLTKRPKIGWVSKAMEQGTLREPDARRLYEFMNDVQVIQVGFVPHPTIAMSGCSPDGYVGDLGLIEIKCPEPAQHIEFLKTNKIDNDYLKQIAWQLSCCPTRQWVDYVSYNPDFIEIESEIGMEYQSKRIHRSGLLELISELEKEVPIFLQEVEAEVFELCSKYRVKEAA